MKYIKVSDGTYPYTFAMLLRDNPNMSFPRSPSKEKLAEWGVAEVVATPAPAPKAGQNVTEGAPVLSGKDWMQTWVASVATAEEVAERAAEAKEAADREAIKLDSFVSTFVDMTPAEVRTHIATNVTNLASAKNVISKLALIVLLMARREFKD